MPEGGWLAKTNVRFYVGTNDGNCISSFRAVVAPVTIRRGLCCGNDATGTRPYSGFAFDVAWGRCGGGRMILLQQQAMALVRPWPRDLQRRRAMMLLRPWQRDDVAVRERDAVAVAGEGSCCGPGEGCIQYFCVGLIQQALFVVCVCVLPTKSS